MNLVFLPATHPEDHAYGQIPEACDEYPQAQIHQVHFPRMVWYNRDVQLEALRQIDALGLESLILIGFSKSALGAWNLARQRPDLVRATLLFDAPMIRSTLPPWGTAPFYGGDLDWQEDLPLNQIDSYQEAMPADHQLILISGATYHEEMCIFSDAAAARGLEHRFLQQPDLPHHWNSGWIEQGLELIRQSKR